VLWNPIQWKWVEIPEFGVLFKKILFPDDEEFGEVKPIKSRVV